ncbi:hypothetical protein MF672_037655 [Actinomadura sp. ATCC 31491]|uniref:Uncharacterized protein n=1 Tax=Actinomadura luzonensis TaxID=2805427 RepID=A0ABT0G4G1_9ACTN|nr:hypothetical protein [Actinomadura luzonensis]MCK2219482.1 hypothetical protein [Actinomadura luzonensis]
MATADIGDHVSERATMDVPSEHLVKGENTVEIVVGAIASSCGQNYDDFVLSDVGLELLGEVADGEDNPYTLSFGDGSCGTNTTLLKRVTLTFFLRSDPKATTGLAADVDTTALSNGEHVLTAATASGAAARNTVTVNNAPAGAPRVLPVDGTLASGVEPVFAHVPAAGDGGVRSLTVDDAEPPARATLGTGAALLSFDVGADGIEDKYDDHLLVNGKRVDLGGTYTGRRVTVAIPARHLVPGDNVIKLVAGDYKDSCGVNRDDFTVSGLALVLDGATVTGQDVREAYRMGDGACGDDQAALREAELRWTIDAPPVRVGPTLGSGDATLSFTVGSNSIEARYQNYVLVNGQKIVLDGDFVSRRVDLTDQAPQQALRHPQQPGRVERLQRPAEHVVPEPVRGRPLLRVHEQPLELVGVRGQQRGELRDRDGQDAHHAQQYQNDDEEGHRDLQPARRPLGGEPAAHGRDGDHQDQGQHHRADDRADLTQAEQGDHRAGDADQDDERPGKGLISHPRFLPRARGGSRRFDGSRDRT